MRTGNEPFAVNLFEGILSQYITDRVTGHFGGARLPNGSTVCSKAQA
jgi:hypothetical protein